MVVYKSALAKRSSSSGATLSSVGAQDVAQLHGYPGVLGTFTVEIRGICDFL